MSECTSECVCVCVCVHASSPCTCVKGYWSAGRSWRCPGPGGRQGCLPVCSSSPAGAPDPPP